MCCRRPTNAQHNDSNSVCDQVERLGSTITARPTTTQAGVVRITTVFNSKRVELFAWIEANKCKGGTSRWILRQKEIIEKALLRNPNLFSKYNGQDVQLKQLSSTARSILVG